MVASSPLDFYLFILASPNFYMKNVISTYMNDFSWKEMAQICQILMIFFTPNCQIKN